MFHESYSVSINTGTPPSYVIGFTVALNVISLQNTFSPGFIPANFIAKWSAAVPEDNATAYLHPTFSQVIFSTSFIFSPTVLIQFVLYASSTHFISSPCIVGDESHILSSKGFICSFTFIPFFLITYYLVLHFQVL